MKVVDGGVTYNDDTTVGLGLSGCLYFCTCYSNGPQQPCVLYWVLINWCLTNHTLLISGGVCGVNYIGLCERKDKLVSPPQRKIS